jgi:hypothetical protein
MKNEKNCHRCQSAAINQPLSISRRQLDVLILKTDVLIKYFINLRLKTDVLIKNGRFN